MYVFSWMYWLKTKWFLYTCNFGIDQFTCTFSNEQLLYRIMTFEWKLVSILLLLYIPYVTDYVLKQLRRVLKSVEHGAITESMQQNIISI